METLRHQTHYRSDTGGMMLVPLLIGAVIRTLVPGAFAGGDAALQKSFTGGLLTGAIPLLAVVTCVLVRRSKFVPRATSLRKGGAPWLAKVGTAFGVALLVRALAADRNHIVFELSALAAVAAFSDTNGGLYVALMARLGNRVEDVAAYSIMPIESGPFFTMLSLGFAGLAHFPIVAFIFALLPPLLGTMLGNLDPAMRDFWRPSAALLIPFFALALGTSIHLRVNVRRSPTSLWP